MTSEMPEARLQDVLDTIHWAMLPLPTPEQLAARMREVMACQAQLLSVVGQVRAELEAAIQTLQAVPPQGLNMRDAAREDMLRHFTTDLAQTRATQETVEHLTATLYAEFYVLL